MERYEIQKIMVLKVVSSLLLCFIVIAGCTSVVDEKLDIFNLRFDPSTIEILNGKETAVFVWVDEANGLIAARFTISFDPSMIEITNIETSGIEFLFTEAGAEVIEIENKYDNVNGKITVGIGALKEGFKGAQGSGPLALIFFKAKSIGISDFNFVNSQPDDVVTMVYSDTSEKGWNEVPAETFNGTITVKKQ